MLENSVILTKHEEEYLVCALEAALPVRNLHDYFLWTQGQFKGLLPHDIMVCIRLSENDEVQRIECLYSNTYAPDLIRRLCDPVSGLAVRLAAYCRVNRLLPCVIDRGERDERHPLAGFQAEINQCQLGNAVVHGSVRLRGGDTFFALFSLPAPPSERQAYFLDLLLPALHLAFERVDAIDNDECRSVANTVHSLLSDREIEVLRWVMKGKSNYEIGMILDLSTLTVKNHMQRIYRKLNVHNRAQAVSRCHALQLLKGREVINLP